MKITRILQAGLITLMLSACASKMPHHTASVESINTLRHADIAAVSVGEFKLAAGKPEAMNTAISSRASSMTPEQGTISAYMKDALITELKSAGKYDPAAKVSISGELTQSELNTNMGTADGTLGAKFRVDDGSTVRYDKELSVRHEWESSIIGAIAIPKAYQEYLALYKKLFLKLFADPGFAKATKSAQ